jgi:putative membrane protein
MEIILESFSGITGFLMYFGAAVIALVVFSRVYSWITPYNEVELIKENNPAAATVFVGALIGFALPLYSALDNSVSLIDFSIWASMALFIQIITFMLVRKLVYPKLSERIEAGEIAAAIKVAGVAIVIGLINAGSMTY